MLCLAHPIFPRWSVFGPPCCSQVWLSGYLDQNSGGKLLLLVEQGSTLERRQPHQKPEGSFPQERKERGRKAPICARLKRAVMSIGFALVESCLASHCMILKASLNYSYQLEGWSISRCTKNGLLTQWIVLGLMDL